MSEPAARTDAGPAHRDGLTADTLASLVYSAEVRLGTLAFSVAAARLGGSAAAGALGVALQFVALGGLVATFNLPQAVAQRLPRTHAPHERRQLLRTSALLVAVFAAVTALVTLLAAPWLARALYSDDTLAGVLRACAPLVLASAAYLWVEGALQGARRFVPMARWGAAVSLADIVAAIATAPLGVLAMLLARTGVRVAGVLSARLAWHREPAAAPADVHPGGGHAAALLRFGGPAFVAGLMLIVGNTLVRALLVRHAGLEAAGHLQAADSIAQGLLLVPLAANNAFVPAASAHLAQARGGDAALFQRALARVSGAGVALCLAAMALAPWVMTQVFGREFAASREAFVWLACAYGMITPASIHGAWLIAHGRTSVILGVQVLWAAVVVALFQWVTHGAGAAGAAQASAAGFLLALLLYALVVAPRLGLSWRCQLPVSLGSAAALLAGTWIALAAPVPELLRAALLLALALVLVLRWTLPAVREQGAA